MRFDVFTPARSGSLAVTASTGSTALSASGASVEVFNDGTVTCFVSLGPSTVTAATTDYPVGPGVTKILGRDTVLHTHIAAITASSTTTLRFAVGDGA